MYNCTLYSGAAMLGSGFVKSATFWGKINQNLLKILLLSKFKSTNESLLKTFYLWMVHNKKSNQKKIEIWTFLICSWINFLDLDFLIGKNILYLLLLNLPCTVYTVQWPGRVELNILIINKIYKNLIGQNKKMFNFSNPPFFFQVDGPPPLPPGSFK